MNIYWQYEDELPEVTESQFHMMFALSRVVDGVRMYPYTKDSAGNKSYLGLVVSE